MSSEHTTLTIEGMHCNACVGRLTKALEPVAASVHVTLNPPKAVLTGLRVAPEVALSAVASAGKYTALIDEPTVSETTASVTASPATDALPDASWATYWPLILLTLFLTGLPLIAQVGQPHLSGADWMRNFMAGFFLAFSFFKLLNIRAFADAYAGYDLLAARWRAWGLTYPFVELALGVAYFVNWNPTFTNSATVLVMGFSILGVLNALVNKRRIQCACLGAVFNLPMSTVTLVEDGLMILMAALALFS